MGLGFGAGVIHGSRGPAVFGFPNFWDVLLWVAKDVDGKKEEDIDFLLSLPERELLCTREMKMFFFTEPDLSGSEGCLGL
jgi:hypothetical protein